VAVSAEAQSRVIAPCLVRPQGLPVFQFLVSPEGACGTTGRFTAPAAPRAVETPSKHMAPCAFRAQGSRCSLRSNGGATSISRNHEGSPPRKQEDACVPHAMDFAACCMSQEASLLPTLVPFV
jgi:hypothetical protein